MRALHELKKRQRDFDLVHDNQCLGYSILGIEKIMPTIVTLHHPITRDRALEMAHTATWRKRYSIGRWYNFVKMQGRVASRLPRIVVVSENSIKDIHADMGVSLDRMRLVPVGVDPELFKPLPHVTRTPGRLITTASADVALKGLSYLLEAMAKLRTERDVTLTIVGKPRDGASNDLIDRLGLRPHIEFVSGVSRRTHRRALRRSRAGRRAQPVRGVQPAGHRGDVDGHLPGRHRRRRAAGGDRPRRRHGAAVQGRRCRRAGRRSSAVGSTTLTLRARVGEAGRRRVVERWSWKHCAQLTVEQYREVLGDAAQHRQVAHERAAVVADDPIRSTRRAAR